MVFRARQACSIADERFSDEHTQSNYLLHVEVIKGEMVSDVHAVQTPHCFSRHLQPSTIKYVHDIVVDRLALLTLQADALPALLVEHTHSTVYKTDARHICVYMYAQFATQRMRVHKRISGATTHVSCLFRKTTTRPDPHPFFRGANSPQLKIDNVVMSLRLTANYCGSQHLLECITKNSEVQHKRERGHRASGEHPSHTPLHHLRAVSEKRRVICHLPLGEPGLV